MKSTFKRLPPILIPFYLLIRIPFILLNWLLETIVWSLGFWRCKACKKVFWVRDEQYYRGYYRIEVIVCECCFRNKTLIK